MFDFQYLSVNSAATSVPNVPWRRDPLSVFLLKVTSLWVLGVFPFHLGVFVRAVNDLPHSTNDVKWNVSMGEQQLT